VKIFLNAEDTEGAEKKERDFSLVANASFFEKSFLLLFSASSAFKKNHTLMLDEFFHENASDVLFWALFNPMGLMAKFFESKSLIQVFSGVFRIYL